MKTVFRLWLLACVLATSSPTFSKDNLSVPEKAPSEEKILGVFAEFELLFKDAIGKIDQSRSRNFYEEQVIRAFSAVPKVPNLPTRKKLVKRYFEIMAMTYGASDEVRGLYLAQIYAKFPDLVENQILKLKPKPAKTLTKSLMDEILDNFGGENLGTPSLKARLRKFSKKINGSKSK